MAYLSNVVEYITSIFKVVYFKIRFPGRIHLGHKARISGLIIRMDSSNTRLIIGDGFSCRRNVILNLSDNAGMIIGNDVFINDNTIINSRNKITIGDRVLIGQSVLIYDHDHDYRDANFRDKFIVGETSIGNDSWICSNAVILRGRKVGSRSVVAAGSIVTQDIPDGCIFRMCIRDEINKIKESR